jgi:hypothetical protein
VAIPASAVQSLVLQETVAVLTLCFGLMALRVAPSPAGPTRRVAWYMAGVAFTFDGGVGTLHSTVAVAAMAAGPGTRFYEGFVRLTNLGNDARILLVLGFALGLGWVVLLGGRPPSARVVVGSAVLLTVTGFFAGLAEGPLLKGGVHFAVMAVLGAGTAVLLFAALYRGMVTESVDWLLWTALALFAAQEAISANIQTVLSWAGFGGGWAPAPRAMLWVGLVSTSIMLACSARRVAIARAGGDPPGLLERLRG